MLYYRNRWVEVLFHLFPHQGRERIREILHLSIQSYYSFIKGMALVYVIVGVLNSVGLLLLGIPQAFLFGFVAAILTFIPYVGIMVGSLLPISMAWITYNSVWYPIGVVIVFAFVQYLEANVIFPFAVSTRLKVNTLITIVAIILGGILWGVAGMILFIPFLGILKLIADRSPGLRTLALILGDEELQ
jgi:predicted PurR-regulated permease PerM